MAKIKQSDIKSIEKTMKLDVKQVPAALEKSFKKLIKKQKDV